MDANKPPKEENRPQLANSDPPPTYANVVEGNPRGSTNIPSAPDPPTQQGTHQSPTTATAGTGDPSTSFNPGATNPTPPAWGPGPWNPPAQNPQPRSDNYPMVQYDVLGQVTRVGGSPGASINDLSAGVRGTAKFIGGRIHRTNRTPPEQRLHQPVLLLLTGSVSYCTASCRVNY
jgi:hypothetical protein